VSSIEIIGRDEYRQHIRKLSEKKYSFLNLDLEFLPHADFVRLLRTKIADMCDLNDLDNEVEHIICLDLLESFSEFPTEQGVYFCIRRGYKSPGVWYVGKANNFRARWSNHHKFNALRTIQDVSVWCLPLPDYSKKELDFVERAYIEILKPVFNNTSNPEKHLKVAS
jgi:hypothetical protein